MSANLKIIFIKLCLIHIFQELSGLKNNFFKIQNIQNIKRFQKI
jgi:hypothetical protein